MMRTRIEAAVREALATLPDGIREDLHNVAIVIEGSSDRDRRRAAHAPDGDRSTSGMLLGVYEGVPRSHYGGDPSGLLPDKITLFEDVIVRESGVTGRTVEEIARRTAWHELAHYFGYGEADARRLEKKWEGRYLEARGGREDAESG